MWRKNLAIFAHRKKVGDHSWGPNSLIPLYYYSMGPYNVVEISLLPQTILIYPILFQNHFKDDYVYRMIICPFCSEEYYFNLEQVTCWLLIKWCFNALINLLPWSHRNESQFEEMTMNTVIIPKKKAGKMDGNGRVTS